MLQVLLLLLTTHLPGRVYVSPPSEDLIVDYGPLGGGQIAAWPIKCPTVNRTTVATGHNKIKAQEEEKEEIREGDLDIK